MAAERLFAVTFDFWETLVRDTPENLARAIGRRSGAALPRLPGVGTLRGAVIGDFAGLPRSIEMLW
jgi:hypothetical protein